MENYDTRNEANETKKLRNETTRKRENNMTTRNETKKTINEIEIEAQHAEAAAEEVRELDIDIAYYESLREDADSNGETRENIVELDTQLRELRERRDGLVVQPTASISIFVAISFA